MPEKETPVKKEAKKAEVKDQPKEPIDEGKSIPVDMAPDSDSSIKLSGLMGTKIGMTQTIMNDGQIIPTTIIKLGPCLALEKKTKNDKTS